MNECNAMQCNAQCRTAWYATLVMSQFVHVFVCKTRFVPMLEHGVFNNSMMNYGCAWLFRRHWHRHRH
jgi:hypothetical protein